MSILFTILRHQFKTNLVFFFLCLLVILSLLFRGKSVSHATNLVEITEDEDELLGDELITEDETDFYSCDDNASIQVTKYIYL